VVNPYDRDAAHHEDERRVGTQLSVNKARARLCDLRNGRGAGRDAATGRSGRHDDHRVETLAEAVENVADRIVRESGRSRAGREPGRHHGSGGKTRVITPARSLVRMKESGVRTYIPEKKQEANALDRKEGGTTGRLRQPVRGYRGTMARSLLAQERRVDRGGASRIVTIPERWRRNSSARTREHPQAATDSRRRIQSSA